MPRNGRPARSFQRRHLRASLCCRSEDRRDHLNPQGQGGAAGGRLRGPGIRPLAPGVGPGAGAPDFGSVFATLEPVFGARDRILLAAAARLSELGAQLHPDHRAQLDSSTKCFGTPLPALPIPSGFSWLARPTPVQIMAVNWPEIAHAHFLKKHRAAVAAAAVGVHGLRGLLQTDAGDRAFEAAFRAMRELDGEIALGQAAHEVFKFLRDLIVARVGDEFVQVARNGADVFGDAPLVVVEDADEFSRGCADVVQRLEGNAVGQRRVAENADDVFIRAALVARRRHAQRGGQRGAGVARAEAVMFALRAQSEAIQSVRLADRAEPLFAAGQNFMNINLVAHVPDKLVLGRGENFVQRNGQLDHAEVRAEMAAAFGETFDQLGADFAGEFLQLRHRELLHVLRAVHHVQVTTHKIKIAG